MIHNPITTRQENRKLLDLTFFAVIDRKRVEAVCSADSTKALRSLVVASVQLEMQELGQVGVVILVAHAAAGRKLVGGWK